MYQVTVVLDRRSVVVHVDDSDSPRTVQVVVRSGDDRATVTGAGWRGVSFGAGGGTGYAWTARELLLLIDPAPPGGGSPGRVGPVDVLRFDEDLVLVVRLATCWVAVCETSVRVVVGRGEVSRVELGDAVLGAVWTGEHLDLTFVEGGGSRLLVSGTGDLRVDD